MDDELGNQIEFEDLSLEERRIAILEGIARGEKDIAEGRTIIHEEVGEFFAKKWGK